MIVKGIVSAIDRAVKRLTVILPEYDDVVTRPIKTYPERGINSLKVNDFVLVVVFNNDFNDCLVIPPVSYTGTTPPIEAFVDERNVLVVSGGTATAEIINGVLVVDGDGASAEIRDNVLVVSQS